MGQKLRKGQRFNAIAGVCQIDLKIAFAKFLHDLTAHTARRKRACDHAVFATANGDSGKFPLSLRNRLEKGSSLCTVGGTIGRIFNVASGIHRAVSAQ